MTITVGEPSALIAGVSRVRADAWAHAERLLSAISDERIAAAQQVLARSESGSLGVPHQPVDLDDLVL